MIELHLSVSKLHKDRLDKLAAVRGISMSELIRRWIDEKYDSQIDAGKRLEEILSLLQQDNTQQGLGNIYHDTKKIQILKEDGSMKEVQFLANPDTSKE